MRRHDCSAALRHHRANPNALRGGKVWATQTVYRVNVNEAPVCQMPDGDALEAKKVQKTVLLPTSDDLSESSREESANLPLISGRTSRKVEVEF